MMDRRRFLFACAGSAFVLPSTAMFAKAAPPLSALDATGFGVYPDAGEDLSAAFAQTLQAAAERKMPVFLPAGDYVVSGLTLPPQVRLAGVPGATRLIHGGGGHFMIGEDAEHIEFTGLVIDGAHGWLGDRTSGLLDLRRIQHLIIDGCDLVASSKHGIAVERVSGRIEGSRVSGAADAGIYSVDASGLRIAANTVSDCGNGGILVHRWQEGDDGTVVSGNRVERIASNAGGTGQNGNGINVYQAANVIVSGNAVSDCAFSAVRANSASNVQITGNTCLRSGETGIYSEFSFQGAIIGSNIVDGAASGISIVNFNEGGRLAVCSGNIVRNLSGVGPYTADPPGFGSGITVEADCAVTGNVVEGAPLYGIAIGWGEFMRNVVATGNIIRRAGHGIAVSVVEGVGSAVIADNLMDGTEKGAIVGTRWSEVVTGDLALTGAGEFPNLAVDGNRTAP